MATTVARAIGERAQTTETILRDLRSAFQPMVRELNHLVMREVDYRQYDEPTRQRLRLTVATAITLRNVIDTPLIDEEGALAPQSARALEGAAKLVGDLEATVA